MAKASTTIEINVTGFDCVKEALAQRDQKIEELQIPSKCPDCGEYFESRELRQGLCNDCWFGRASERRQRREKIAVVVMQGLLSNSAIQATDDDLIKEAAANAAKACVAITDALIAELGKEQKL